MYEKQSLLPEEMAAIYLEPLKPKTVIVLKNSGVEINLSPTLWWNGVFTHVKTQPPAYTHTYNIIALQWQVISVCIVSIVVVSISRPCRFRTRKIKRDR